MRRSEGKKPYTFYDGPPFATGLPHYGHIAAGTIKVSSMLFSLSKLIFFNTGCDDKVRHPDWTSLPKKIWLGLPWTPYRV
jgi:hypothetical protein